MGASASQHAGAISLPFHQGELHWAHYAVQGKRDAMEDTFVAESLGEDALFGVFDGHYGKRAAQYAAEHLPRVLQSKLRFGHGSMTDHLRDGFLALDKELLDKSRAENWHDGTTALVALLTTSPPEESSTPKAKKKRPNKHSHKTRGARNHWNNTLSASCSSEEGDHQRQTSVSQDVEPKLAIYIANAGDCRAISVYGSGKLYQLSTDHNPQLPFERYRIFKAGGMIRYGRIDGKLSVSRGFGDRQFKEPHPWVSAIPEIVSFTITPELRFVLLACDGLWGWLTNVQVGKFVAKSLKEGNRPDVVCKDLVKYALDQGSTDNISVILLYFTHSSENSNGDLSSVSLPQLSLSTPTTIPPPLNPMSWFSSSAGASSSSFFSSSDRRSGDRTRIPLSTVSSSGKGSHLRKFNYLAAAEALTWNLDIDWIDRRLEKAEVVKTHLSTGEHSYLDEVEPDTNTSEADSSSIQPVNSREKSATPPATTAATKISSNLHHHHHHHYHSDHVATSSSSHGDNPTVTDSDSMLYYHDPPTKPYQRSPPSVRNNKSPTGSLSTSPLLESPSNNNDNSDSNNNSNNSNNSNNNNNNNNSNSNNNNSNNNGSSSAAKPTVRKRRTPMPDDDEHDGANFGSPTLSPRTPRTAGFSSKKSTAHGKRQSKLADSDSEDSEEIAQLYRERMSLEGIRMPHKSRSASISRSSTTTTSTSTATTTAATTTTATTSGHHGPRRSTGPRRTKSNTEEDSSEMNPLERHGSAPLSPQRASPHNSKKKSSGTSNSSSSSKFIIDDDDGPDEYHHRRVASFDFVRHEKSKKKAKQR